MRWKNTSTPTFAGSAGSAGKASVVETMQLLDDDGNECAVFTKAVDGAKSATVGGVATGGLYSYLAAAVTYNANAVLADTALSVTVAAGGIYAIELVVHSTSAVKALNMDFGGTATIANFIGDWSCREATNTSGSVTLFSVARITAAGTDFSVHADLDGGNSIVVFTGSVEITDAGTFLLRGAQNVSDASNTTILRGSTLKLTKLN